VVALGVLVAAMVSGLAACTPPKPVPLEPAALLSRISSRSLDDAAVVAALQSQRLVSENGAGPRRWDLDAMTVAAWALRSELAVTAARERVAAASVVEARQFPNPVLSLTPELITNAATGTSPWTAAVLLTWLIRAPGARAAAIDQARAASEGAVWDGMTGAWDIRSQVRSAMLDLVLAQRSVALADEELGLRRQAVEMAQTRVRVGAWEQPELDRAGAEQLAAQNESASASAAAHAAMLRVASATGLTGEAALPATLVLPKLDDMPKVLASVRVPDRDAVVLNRLDVARALADYRGADAAWRAQVARRFPDLGAGPGYTYDKGDHKIVVTLSGEVPLLHTNSAAEATADARRREAAAAVEVVQQTALAQFDRAGAAVAAAAERLAGAQRVVAARRSAVAAQRKRQLSGAGDRSDVVARELELLAARRSELEALRATVDALSEFETSVQRPLWPPSKLDVRREQAPDRAARAGATDTSALDTRRGEQTPDRAAGAAATGDLQKISASQRTRHEPAMSSPAKESLP